MLENKIRPLFQQAIIEPVAKSIANYCSPNMVTLASLITGILTGLFISIDWGWLAVMWLLLSGYLDMLDGSIARLTNTSSSFGTILDIMCDRTVEVIIFFAFALRAPELWFVYMLMMGTTLLCVSSFLVVGIFSTNVTNKSFYYSPGLIERAEAFLFFIAIILLPGWQITLAIIYSILTLWTAGFRLFEFYRNLQGASQ